jgi:tetratricopeptide (TPR) repeat protein
MNARRIAVLSFLVLAGAVCASAQETGPNTFIVWLPGKPWVMEIDGPGFTTRVNEIQKDGRRYFVAENPETHVLLSVYLEDRNAPATVEECKRVLQERATSNSPYKRSGVTFRESGAMQVLEYSILEVDGVPLNQRNLFACVTKDTVFADIHLSKASFKPWDLQMFEGILQSVRFPDHDPVAESVPTGNSLEYFKQGSRFFMARQYKDSIGPYNKALEIEKLAPTLDRNLWRVLIDNLGTAYGILLDPDHAQEIFEYGISKDPTYPLFYYNLACAAADKEDMAAARQNLKLAYQYRKNMISGEQFPDARIDESFQIFMRNDEFRQFVNALYGTRQ